MKSPPAASAARAQGEVGEDRNRAKVGLPGRVGAPGAWVDGELHAVAAYPIERHIEEIAGEMEARLAIERNAAQHAAANLRPRIVPPIQRVRLVSWPGGASATASSSVKHSRHSCGGLILPSAPTWSSPQ